MKVNDMTDNLKAAAERILEWLNRECLYNDSGQQLIQFEDDAELLAEYCVDPTSVNALNELREREIRRQMVEGLRLGLQAVASGDATVMSEWSDAARSVLANATTAEESDDD